MKKKSELDKYKLKYEDKKGKLKLSSTAGKPKPIAVRAFETGKKATKHFFTETYKAIMIILRGIL